MTKTYKFVAELDGLSSLRIFGRISKKMVFPHSSGLAAPKSPNRFLATLSANGK